MNPNPLADLEQIIERLREYSIFSINNKKERRLMPPPLFAQRPPVLRRTAGTASVPPPLQTLARGLSSTLSQLATRAQEIIRRPPAEDYEAILKKFIPADAKLLTPEYPSKSREIQLADLDGDSQNELVASYRLNDEIRTTILKKNDNGWYKAAETNISGYDTVNYRGIDSLAGQGSRQLLMGYSAMGKTPVLHGYELGKDGISKVFTHSYRWFELMKPSKSEREDAGAQLAIWNEKDRDAYDIEVLRWDGLQLEPQSDTSSYYGRSVVPYYVRKVRNNPNSLSNWYNLADALVNAGAYRDASIAVEVGMRLDAGSEYKEQFEELKRKMGKI